MLKSHKNKLYDAIKECGFAPEQFNAKDKWANLDTGARDGLILTFKGTDIQFVVRTSPQSYNAFDCLASQYAPGWPLQPYYAHDQYAEIDMIAHHLGEWLGGVVRPYLEEQTVPDLWADLEKQFIQGSDLTLTSEVKAEKFSVLEYEQVSKTLDVVKALLVTYAERNENTTRHILSEINGLKEMAKIQDRKTFFHQVVGYLLTTANFMGLGPEQTKALFEAVRQGLQSVIKFLN